MHQNGKLPLDFHLLLTPSWIFGDKSLVNFRTKVKILSCDMGCWAISTTTTKKLSHEHFNKVKKKIFLERRCHVQFLLLRSCFWFHLVSVSYSFHFLFYFCRLTFIYVGFTSCLYLPSRHMDHLPCCNVPHLCPIVSPPPLCIYLVFPLSSASLSCTLCLTYQPFFFLRFPCEFLALAWILTRCLMILRDRLGDYLLIRYLCLFLDFDFASCFRTFACCLH